MKTLMAGPDGVVQPDSVISVTKKKAKELIEGGYAVPAKGKVESTSAGPPENTSNPSADPGAYVLDSGKHEGKTLSEVPDKYLEYLSKLGKTDEVKAAAAAELANRS